MAQRIGHHVAGWVFTDEIGRPLSPDCLTRTFNALVEESRLPPLRLHDLRHGAATRRAASAEIGAILQTAAQAA